MDQTTGQIIAGVLGGGGVTGVVTQFLSLRRDKRREQLWRSEMERRTNRLETEVKELRSQSPDALVKRLEQSEDFRAQERRDTVDQINRLRNALRETLDELGRIQQRLNIPAV